MISMPRIALSAAGLLAAMTLLHGQAPKAAQGKTLAGGAPVQQLMRKVLVRGETVRLSVPAPTSGVVSLYREAPSGGIPAGPGAAIAISPNPIATFAGTRTSETEIEFTVPMTVPAGRYGLQFKAGDVKSPLIAVTIVDPKMKVIAFDTKAGVGGKVWFGMNHCAPTAKFIFNRVYAQEPPPFWWAPYRSTTLSTCALTPSITKKDGGSVSVSVTAPAALGGGVFEVRIQNPASPSIAVGQIALIYPPNPMPNYSLRYNGIDCLIDTNEIGDDEVYAIFVRAAQTAKFDPTAQKWFKNNWFKPSVSDGPVHMGLDKGVSRNASQTVIGAAGDSPYVDLGLAVILQERDDDENGDKKYFTNNLGQQFQTVGGNATPENVASFADGGYKNAKNNYDFLDDDLIGIAGVSLSNAKKAALSTEGWHAASVTITGDGGKFRLRFSVRCDPWKKGPSNPWGLQAGPSDFPGGG